MDARTLTTGVQLAVRAGVGAGVTLAMAQSLNMDFPIYAALAAVIATDLTPPQSRRLGLRRLAATVIGALCGTLLTLIVVPSAWSVGLSVMCAMLVCELFKVRDGAKLAGYVCSLIVLHHGGDPLQFALNRFIETVFGITVAWIISYVPKLIGLSEDQS